MQLGAVDNIKTHGLDQVSNVIGIGQCADAARAVQTAGVHEESEGPPSMLPQKMNWGSLE